MVMPPLGLWYLAAQLEAQGHHTDFRALDVDELPLDGDYDQLWMGATSPQMHEVRRIANLTSGWLRTQTVLGGAAAWANPGECQKLPFDLVVSGESDHPLSIKSIVNAVGSNTRLLKTNITLGELDWVLPPVRRWDEKYNFSLTDRYGIQHRATTLFTSRGCPMACAFCESGRNGVIWDRFVRYEPVSLVDAQLREIVDRGHTAVMFYDDILPLNKPRTLAILKLLKKYNLAWRCFIRTDVIEKQGGFDYLREMADAGLVEVLAGVESADNRVKNAIHKGTTIEQDTQALQWCKQLGIKFKASFILGLPGETRESMAATRDWILTHKPDRADVNTLIPFPGTPITRTHDADGAAYDVQWEAKLPEEYFYKGARHATNALTRTAALTAQEIGDFREALVREIEAAGIGMAVMDKIKETV